MKKTLKRHGSPAAITTDGLRSYGVPMTELGNAGKREIGRHANNPGEELAPAVPTTRAGDAPVEADEEPAKVRFSPRQPAPLWLLRLLGSAGTFPHYVSTGRCQWTFWCGSLARPFRMEALKAAGDNQPIAANDIAVASAAAALGVLP